MQWKGNIQVYFKLKKQQHSSKYSIENKSHIHNAQDFYAFTSKNGKKEKKESTEERKNKLINEYIKKNKGD